MSTAKRNRQRGGVGIWVVVVILLGAIGAGAYMYFNRKPAPVTYKDYKVEKGSVAVTILTTGTVKPENRLEIKPPIAGRVEEVLIKEGDTIKRGQVLAWMSSTERAALLDAARSKGPEEVARWEEIYRPTAVLAPINGTIIQKSVEAGQTFSNTDSILVMSDRLAVKAQVDETDMAQVRLNQEAQIILDAYPGKKIPSKVGQIAFEATTVNNVTTYIVNVIPSHTPEFMRSGMTANVTFFLKTKDNVLLLSAEAIRTDAAGRTVVYIKEGEAPPREIEVKTGITDGKRTEIVEGLQEGQTIVVAQSAPKDSKGSNPLFGGPPRGLKGGRR